MTENEIYPISTDKTYISNKSIDYRIYIAFLIDSTFNTILEFRYTYFDKFNNNKSIFCEKMKINRKNLNLKINNFLKNVDLVKVENMLNDNLELVKIYEFKFLEKNFVMLSEKELKKLITCSSNEIKIYLIIKYLLNNKENRDVELRYLAQKTGLSETNSKTIKKIIDNLKEKDLIEYKNKFKFKDDKNIKIYNFKIKKEK